MVFRNVWCGGVESGCGGGGEFRPGALLQAECRTTRCYGVCASCRGCRVKEAAFARLRLWSRGHRLGNVTSGCLFIISLPAHAPHSPANIHKYSWTRGERRQNAAPVAALLPALYVKGLARGSWPTSYINIWTILLTSSLFYRFINVDCVGGMNELLK